jgi:conjugal transfer ATP-binding protein TraC
MTAAREFRGARASALFPVLAYDAADGLFFLDDQSLGFGFLCQPLAGAPDGAAERLSVLLNQDWPTDTLVQVLLWASPDLEEPLAGMRGLRIDRANALLREATAERAAFLRAGVAGPLGPGSDLRVRDLAVIVTVKLPLAEALPTAAERRTGAELRATLHQVLATAGLAPETLSADRYVRLLNTLLNWAPAASWRDRIVPECDPQRLIRDQLLDYDVAVEVDARGLHLGTTRVQTVSVKRYPDRVGFGLASRFLSDPASGTRGVRHNVLLSLNLHFPDPESTRAGLTAQRQWAANMAYGPLVKYLPQLGARKRGFDALFEALDRGDRTVLAYFGVVLFTPEEEAVAALSNLRTYWRELGFQVLPDRFFCLPLFLHCLPFGAERGALKDLVRYRTLATGHAVSLLPVFGDWKGTGTPVLNLVSRSGQLMALSLFDTTSNYNAVIAAQSGSGKSFLTNELISTNLSVGGRCWVIDVGRSYQNLCEALDGQFLAFARDSAPSLNPFELIRNWEEEADVITALVTAMAAPTEPLGDYRTAGLKRVLRSVWDAHGTAMTVDDVANALRADPDHRVQDVGNQLYPFTTAGEYGRFFNGRNTIAFGADFVVLELEELKGRKHLQQVVLLQLIYQIQQAMFLGDREQPKLVIIDEAWDLLTQGDVARFIEAGYRRFRKYRGAAITVTQSLNDLYGNPTGRAIAENSAQTFLLAQPSQAIDQLRAERRLPMTDAGAELLKTVHTVPGAYSEILVLTGRGGGIGRLVVDPFRRLLYSTDPQDVAALRRLRATGLTVPAAIRTLLADRARAA